MRLSNLEDIPFPDVLHLLNACLRGFEELAGTVGYFRVDEEQIGISESGNVKVWLNTAFESMQVVGNHPVPEHEMLQDILGLVFQAEDPDSYPPNIPRLANAVSVSEKALTFQSVSAALKDYAAKYTRSFIPSSLQCVHAVGGA